jgi:hypothetical protein
MSLSDFRFCTYRLSHLGEEKMLLFSAFQALMVGLKSATVVFAPTAHSSPQNLLTCHLIYQQRFIIPANLVAQNGQSF